MDYLGVMEDQLKFAHKDAIRKHLVLLISLVDVPNAVRTRRRTTDGCKAHLNDALGTILKVCGTTVTVSFDVQDQHSGQWTGAATEFIPADWEQDADGSKPLAIAFSSTHE